MANIDETPLYSNMCTSTTVQTIRSNKVILKHKKNKVKNKSNLNNSCVWRKADTFISL